MPLAVFEPHASPDDEVEGGRLDRDAFDAAGDLLRGEPLAQRSLRSRVLPDAEQRVRRKPDQAVDGESGSGLLPGEDGEHQHG